MKCPACNSPDSRVLDSRPIEDGSSIKRRRECPSCGKRFTTFEVIETVAITVVKRNGTHEFFDANKLAHGIERACQKRPVDPLAIAKDIEAELHSESVEQIFAKDIGEMVLARLKEKDVVSYIRFASVYREFSDIDSFVEEINRLAKKGRRRAGKTASQEK